MSNKLYDILEEPRQVSSEEEVDSKPKPNTFCEKGLLISIIADEDTCVGFLLGGIGEVTEDQRPNYFVVNRKTKNTDIEKAFKEFSRRTDIGMILITRQAADMIHAVISSYKRTVPTVMQIPGIYGPYEFINEDVLHKAEVSLIIIF
ncbi:V-type proton ATPase subunit F-like [Anoplophora glabripennis]|uniref:V-type proton ATPase subunit F-like n=1 Tax=Anoplophora glabripennis TaxID=217634 RepID=UPI0008748479|nr:V-type proton ATPase subunit F-like [Anoplophora glabripennis]